MMAAEKPVIIAVLALETFAAEVGGETYTVRAGDKLLSNHPVAVAHPSRFRESGPTD